MLQIRTASSCLVLLAALAGCGGAPKPADVRSALPAPPAMAQQAEGRGDWDGAARHWQAAVEADPANRAARLSLARALRLSGSCGPAGIAIAPVLTKAPADAEALVESAKCHLVSGRPEAAEAQLGAAAKAAPESWDAEATLAVTLDRMGRHAEAQAHHDRALTLGGDRPTLLANKALSLALSGQLDGALALMRVAASIPGAPARVRMNLATIEALSGNADRATTIASQEVFDGKGDSLQTLNHLAGGARGASRP